MAGKGPNRVRVESYGCTMNQGEGALAAELLASRGYDVHGEDADTVLIFTCDVIEATENRMWKRISSEHEAGKKVVVAGCLAAISGPEVLRRFPGSKVIGSMGTSNLRRSIEDEFPVIGPANGTVHGPVIRVHHIVPISTGCLGSCTYCITKEARKGIVSNPPVAILDEVKKGIARGRKEILLTSQDSAAYGLDGTGEDLSDLLTTVGKVPGDHMIRVGMMNPEHVLVRIERILDSYSSGRIFKFFHIPLQSGSDRILSMMGRGYTAEDFFRIVDAIRDRYPGSTISTDMIVGFPGEGDEDHRANLDALDRLRPDILNVTRFSPRPGTAAASMEGRILQRTVKHRSREMVAAHTLILDRILESRVSSGGPVLVTELGKRGTVMGRDVNYTPIVVKGSSDLLGRWIEVDRTGHGPTYLLASYVRTIGGP